MKFRPTLLLVPLFSLLVLSAAFLLKINFESQISFRDQMQGDRMQKMMAPADHWYLQRSYPDEKFDFKAYEAVLKSEHERLKQRTAKTASIEGNWRIEGPGNIGGRINALAIHPTDDNIIYAGCAAGGIFKTTNGGSTWISIFDDQPFLAIGAITIDPSNSDHVYVGTGDPNISGHPFIGDGIWKSTDAGATWTHLGLFETRIISKIVVDPTNPNNVYAGAMGLPMERNTDRGLYKSTDFGATWNQVLFVADQAGIIDLVIDPFNPTTLYASSWDRIRTNQESVVFGANAKIWKTTDGGATWNTVMSGLPTENKGRINLGISHDISGRLYASIVDSTSNLLGVYKTYNGGTTWNLLPQFGLDTDALAGFGWYFGNIYVNPNDEDDVYLNGVQLWRTTDGGTNWSQNDPPWWTYSVHADKHALGWLSSGGVVIGTDGGMYKSTDGGSNWTDIEYISNTQFYRVAFNPHEPGYYYGGAQDNGTCKGQAIFINTWSREYGGDGFNVLFDPVDPDIRIHETQWGNIVASDDAGASFFDFTFGIDGSDRTDWDTPIIMSHHDHTTFYAGSYRIYKNTGGIFGIWYDVSPDLTDGVIFRPTMHTIYCIGESPIDANNVYAGTTDGNVWNSLDAGSTWNDVTGSLPDRVVTSIKGSPSIADRVYVTHSGYKYNEFIPHIHRSDDNGTTWTDISGDLPQFAVNDIVIDPTDENVLIVATDGGVYGSNDGGVLWDRVGSDMPIMPVYDMEIDTVMNRLVAGTHARGIWTFPMDSVRTSLITEVPAELDNASDLSVYPSPAVEQITVEMEDSFRGEILDLSGKVMHQFDAESGKVVIKVNEWPAGVYLVRAQNNAQPIVKRFIKQ